MRGYRSISDAIAGLDPEVVAMLREDLPVQRDAAIAAMNAGDWQHARDVVHSVNGSASFCRLHELQSAATALEQELDAGQAGEALRRAFLEAIDRTMSALG